jgi:hypothetical protein
MKMILLFSTFSPLLLPSSRGKCKKPGMAGVTCNEGKGGFTYVLITPKNASDPLYVEWTKEGDIGGKKYANPVVNSTGDDPSTAWKTKDGEWRIIGNQKCTPENGNPMYGSIDFISWYKIGCTTMMAGDCPSFFPLPGLTPGSAHYVKKHLKDGPMPDHVHKSGGKGGDQTQVGNWVDGKPGAAGTGTVGTWTLTAGSKTQFLDKGKTHASKDFYDPIGKRQVRRSGFRADTLDSFRSLLSYALLLISVSPYSDYVGVGNHCERDPDDPAGYDIPPW